MTDQEINEEDMNPIHSPSETVSLMNDIMTELNEKHINESVARRLGWEDSKYPIDNKEWCVRNGEYNRWDDMDYCHSIAAAWEIVEWIHENGGRALWKPCFELSQSGNGWQCRLRMEPWDHADTAPMAICLAFLKLP